MLWVSVLALMPDWTAIGTKMQPWWPALTAAGVVLGFLVRSSARYGRKVKQWLHLGVRHIDMAAKINAATAELASVRRDLAASEHARASLRAILEDLRSSLDVEELNLASLRAKLTVAERMLETHSLNEAALFADRAALIGWGDGLALQVRHLGGSPSSMPSLSGSEVAEIEDFEFAHDSAVTKEHRSS